MKRRSLWAIAAAAFLPCAELASCAEGADDDVRGALAPRAVFRAALELTAACQGRTLAAPGWCARPGQAVVAPDGGITVTVNDEVELELTVPPQWAVGRHAFLIVSSEGDPRAPKAAVGTLVDFGVPGTQVLRFRPQLAGEYQFLEPFGRSITGRLTVRP